MNGVLKEQMESIYRRYEEAYVYVSGNTFFMNPTKAYLIFKELADEGFVAAKFYCGLMLCMGIGTEKNIDSGKEMLKAQEKYLGYVTEIVMEKIVYLMIYRWKNN